MAVDLHLHSIASDGTLTPREIIGKAAEAKLSAVSITDHDTVESIPVALAAADDVGIELIPGLEMSSVFHNRDVHILGYYVDYTSDRLLEQLAALRQARDHRAVKMLDKLAELGLPTSMDEVRAVAGEAAVGRPHVAKVLVKRGYVGSMKDAFDQYLTRGGPAYVEKYTLAVDQVIALIRGAGGVAVVAHPAVSRLDTEIDYFVELGLSGIEAYHSDHGPEEIQRYLGMAERLHLAVTGGSDSHGPGSSKDFSIGAVPVPDSCVDSLKQRRLATT